MASIRSGGFLTGVGVCSLLRAILGFPGHFGSFGFLGDFDFDLVLVTTLRTFDCSGNFLGGITLVWGSWLLVVVHDLTILYVGSFATVTVL